MSVNVGDPPIGASLVQFGYDNLLTGKNHSVLECEKKIKKIRISKVLSYLAPYTETGPRVLNSFVGVFNLTNRLGEDGLQAETENAPERPCHQGKTAMPRDHSQYQC